MPCSTFLSLFLMNFLPSLVRICSILEVSILSSPSKSLESCNPLTTFKCVFNGRIYFDGRLRANRNLFELKFAIMIAGCTECAHSIKCRVLRGFPEYSARIPGVSVSYNLTGY